MSGPQSAPSQSDPTQPKSPGRRRYVAAVVVLSILLIGASGASVYYYDQRGLSVNHAADLDTQIASLNSQISSDKASIDGMNAKITNLNVQIGSDKTSIDGLNTQITSLNQRISQLELTSCTPDSGFTGCSGEIANLQSKINQLQSDKVALQGQVSQLQATVDNLTTQVAVLADIIDLKASKVVANQVTLPWAENTHSIPIPEAILTYNYSGFFIVKWQSTDPLTFSLTYTLQNKVFTVMSATSSSSNSTIPIVVSPLAPTKATASFENNNTDCFFHPCSGTVTYTITYWY